MPEQECFTVDEIAKLLKISADSVTPHFENESGVIDLGWPETRHNRRYRVLRIPAAVLNRFRYKKQVR
jgi:hypothetical protein